MEITIINYSTTNSVKKKFVMIDASIKERLTITTELHSR